MFRKNLFTGLLVALPIAAALWIIVSIARAVDQIYPDGLRPKIHGIAVPGLGLVLALVILFFAGALARNVLGQRLLKPLEQALARIPVFGKTYGLMKQIVQTVFGKQGEAFRHAVLVRFPHADVWSIGFVAGTHPEIEMRTGRKILPVYVPTTPNPTSGYYLFFPEEQTIPLEIPVDQALKLIVTMGIVKTEGSGLISLQPPKR